MTRLRTVTRPLLFGIALAALLAPVPARATSIVFDNTTNSFGSVGLPGTSGALPGQRGDEITLTGGGLVTQFRFQTNTGSATILDGDETIIIRFFVNEGPGSEPGTLLFQSLAVPLTEGQVTRVLSGLNVAVPDTFTWTAEVFQTDSSESVLLTLSDPPVVGSSGNFLWTFSNSTSTWSQTQVGLTPAANLWAEVTVDEDFDGDGVGDSVDNCPFVPNGGQENSDGLQAGDACQCGDVNTDFVVNATDVQLVREHLMDVTPLSGPFDPTRCNVIGLSDGGVTDCDVSDIFVLQRFLGGQPVTVENSCAAYGPPGP